MAFEDPIADLERICDHDPGNPAFPALAEMLRRAGRLEEAREAAERGLVASPDSAEGRMVWLLIQLDAGKDPTVRERLEAWAEGALGPYAEAPQAAELLPETPVTEESEEPEVEVEAEGVSEHEFERAFAAATPEIEEMITPDRVAEEAAIQADAGWAGDDPPIAEVAGDPLADNPTFATETMAALLERQGDSEGAARIRANLEDVPTAEPVAAPLLREAPVGTLATLERWLDNARRMQ
ncbi:MAG: tetratricopeptide repeat protein [Myxococcota bacterium]